MSRLKPSERSKTKQMGEIIERESSTHSNPSSSPSNLSSLSSTSSTLSSSLSSSHSSSITSSSPIGDKIVCLAYPIEPVEKTSSSAYNNEQYDDGVSSNFDVLRGSKSSGQVDCFDSIYMSPDNILDFSASVGMVKQANKMTSLISTILYDICSDNITWLWLALYVLTYR
jgi:hypothetical protein